MSSYYADNFIIQKWQDPSNSLGLCVHVCSDEYGKVFGQTQ